jgi:hypothetical protein
MPEQPCDLRSELAAATRILASHHLIGMLCEYVRDDRPGRQGQELAARGHPSHSRAVIMGLLGL